MLINLKKLKKKNYQLNFKHFKQQIYFKEQDEGICYKFYHTVRKTINKTKRQPTEGEKRFANEKSDKGLISKMYKELIQLNSKSKIKQFYLKNREAE